MQFEMPDGAGASAAEDGAKGLLDSLIREDEQLRQQAMQQPKPPLIGNSKVVSMGMPAHSRIIKLANS